jgi:hypothetical protein
VRGLDLDDETRKAVAALGFITAKKVLYVANVDDADPHGDRPAGDEGARARGGRGQRRGGRVEPSSRPS